MKKYLSKYLYILGGKRKKLICLVGLFVTLAFLDLIGISLIGSFVAAVSTPETLSQSTAWQSFKFLLSSDDDHTGLIVLGGLIVLVFYIKGCGAFWAQKHIVKFSYNHQSDLMNTLMGAYQMMPYQYHIQRNSASLIQAIIRHTDVYTSQTLIASLRLVSDITVLVIILIFLAMTNFIAMLSMVCLLVAVAAIYDKIVKHRIQRAGKTMADSQKEIIKNIHHAIGGLKEIRLLGIEKYFQNNVKERASVFANSGATFRALTLLPRYFIESSMVTFIVGLAIFTILAKSETSHFLPTLSIFGMAAIRLMPSGNTIIASINDLRYSKYAVNELYQDLIELDKEKKNIQSAYKMFACPQGQKQVSRDAFNIISMNGISFKYQQTESFAIDEINIEIQRGGALGLIGSSGSGKTTLVNVLLGFLNPQKGTIEIDGVPVNNNTRSWYDLFAYIPQDVHLIDDTIRRNIALGIADSDINEEKLLKVIREVQLEQLVEQLSNGLDTMVGERGVRLSGGQKQRVALARAFYYEREIVVMDEATAALDNETEQQIVAAIKNLKGKKTLIVIAHRLTTVQHCDVIYRLESGKIVAVGDFESVVGAV